MEKVSIKIPGPFSVVTPDGAKLSGYRSGTGNPVFFISGLGGTAAFWNPVVAEFSGFESICIDQRGIGQSSRGSAQVTVTQLAQDVLHVLDELGIGSVTLVGHSTGGCIAMETALLAPERVNALVLSGTWAGKNQYMEQLFKLRRLLLHKDPALYHSMNPYISFSADWLTQHPDLIPDYNQKAWSKGRVEIVDERIAALLEFDRRNLLNKLVQPCLVLGAEDDLVVPNFLQREIVSLIPDAQHVFFPTGGHFYPLSRKDEFLQTLLDWRQKIQ